MKPLFLSLALTLSTLAGTVEPAQVALDFLTKVRTGKINLEPGGDTALSANTEADKRREITRRLERTASDLDAGTLEPGEVVIDDTLAAVIIRKLGGFDPARLRVFAVAMVKQGDVWHPAPVLGSFENTGLGFDPKLRQRARQLEAWMLDNQAKDLETLRQQATDRMRTEILACLTVEDLRKLSADEVGRRFLDACAKPQLPAMLGLLGGLQTILPEDWSSRLQAADAAVANPAAAKRPWRLLVAPEILRTIVHQESENRSALLSVACLDPTQFPGNPAQPKIEFVHMKLSKSPDDLWQVDPPMEFFQPVAKAQESDEEDDSDLLDEYPATLRKAHPLQPQPSVAAAVAALQSALRAPTPAPLIALLDLSGPGKPARLGITRAVAAWGALHDPTTVRSPVLLGVFENDAIAAVSFQYFSVRNDALDLRVFYFGHKDAGWHLLSGMAPGTRLTPQLQAASTWAEGEAKRWAETWREKLLTDSQHLTAIPTADAPSEADARKLIGSWLDAVRTGSIAEALALTAWLDPEKSPSRVLRNLGFEINSARKAKTQPVITAIARGKAWTTATVRANLGDKPTLQVYPIVSTPHGPRLLLEVDLFANPDRGREFLNNASLSHLRDFTRPEIATELQELFKKPPVAANDAPSN